jgi:hypothetical protein
MRLAIITTQYLTIFVSQIDGCRVLSIQGLIAFDHRLFVNCPLSPLVPDFEEGIRKVNPAGGKHLWNILKKTTNDLVAFTRPGDGNK